MIGMARLVRLWMREVRKDETKLDCEREQALSQRESENSLKRFARALSRP